jgi:hypothetical protein
MHNTDRKYIHVTDAFGEMLAYIDDYQPNAEDTVFGTVIAERVKPEDEWQIENRNTMIAIVLNSKKKWKFYEDYEEFGAEFLDAIL